MSFELPPPTAGIWLIPKRFRQLCRLAGFVKMTGVPIFRNKIQGLPFHHQETTRKKWGEMRKSTKGLATCQSLGARFSHVTVGSYGGTRDRISALQFPASRYTPVVDSRIIRRHRRHFDSADAVESNEKRRSRLCDFDVLRIDVETETIKKDVHGFSCLTYIYIYTNIYIYAYGK